MSENPERATSVGQTGGLPGANADPRAKELTEDEMADTVSMSEATEGGRPAEDRGPTGSNG